MQSDAFIPQSNTMLITTSGTTLTPATQAVSFPGTAPAQMLAGNGVPPPNVLLENMGTAVIWVSITLQANRTAAIPAAGQTTWEVPLQPGQSKAFRCPFPGAGAGGQVGAPGVQNNQGQGPATTLYVNTISVGTSQNLGVTFGEGV